MDARWMPVFAAAWLFYIISLVWPARLRGVAAASPRLQRVKVTVGLLFMDVVLDGWRRTSGREAGGEATGLPLRGMEAGDRAPADDGNDAFLRVTLKTCVGIRLRRTIAAGRGRDEARRDFTADGEEEGGFGGAGMNAATRWYRFARVSQGAGRVVRRRMTVECLQVRAVIGTGDAAMSGWLAGGLWALFGIGQGVLLQAFSFSQPPAIHVVPSFGVRRFHFTVKGRGSLRQGWLAVIAGMLVWAFIKTRWLQPAAERLGRRWAKGGRFPWAAAAPARRG